MVGARRLHLDRKPRGARMRELLGVNPRHEAARSPGRENPPRLRDRERAAIAVHIAKFREACRRDRRNPALYEQIDKRIRAAAKFRRHHVRAEKRAGDIERLRLMQIVEDFERLLLALPIEAVAALGLERRGAMRRELAQICRSASDQRRRTSAPQSRDRGANSATRARDFLVCFSGDALFVLGGAGLGENQVRVRIDKSRQHDAPA